MALAAVLRFAAMPWPSGASVVLPAYSCPDVVAAAQFAGLGIRFADFAPGQTGIDPSALSALLQGGSRIAVPVDLFGVHAPVSELRSVADRHQAVLVHDRAQGFAGPGLAADETADFVIVSRGRGKPATLLGGGAAWARDSGRFKAFAATQFPLAIWRQSSALLRASLYNLLMAPLLYGAVTQLPWLHIGKTRLQALAAVTRLPQNWLVHAARQIARQQACLDRRRERTTAIADLIPAADFRVPADAMKTAIIEGLNRFPVLCRDVDQASRLLAQGARLGISPMYGRTLPEFLGVSSVDAAAAYPVAYRFSRTVITVPTHERIGDAERMKLRKLFRDAS
jgi:dTDP-4-amino-4,6-dideoxygalactose transaminase